MLFAFRIFKLKKKTFFSHTNPYNLPLHNDQRSPGLISHIAWGTCAIGSYLELAIFREDFSSVANVNVRFS